MASDWTTFILESAWVTALYRLQTLEAGARVLLRRESCSLRGALAHFLQDGKRLSFGPAL